MNPDENTDKDIRLADLLNQSENVWCRLVGFPSDVGVRINGGRPGAAEAPGHIRHHLYKFTSHPKYKVNHQTFLESVHDAGDLDCSGDVAADQARLGEFISECLQKNILPIVMGGGHETTFGHFLGYAKQQKPVHIINIDAHTDVRPLKRNKPHSGSPFYQAVTHASGICLSYNVLGLNPATVSEEHYLFAKKYGTTCFEENTTLEKVQSILKNHSDDHFMITMDMDALNQVFAPGVSAPNSSGIDVDFWLELAFEFGKCPNVSSFDLCEVNPLFDRDEQTSRLAARTIWNFLFGVSQRKK